MHHGTIVTSVDSSRFLDASATGYCFTSPNTSTPSASATLSLRSCRIIVCRSAFCTSTRESYSVIPCGRDRVTRLGTCNAMCTGTFPDVQRDTPAVSASRKASSRGRCRRQHSRSVHQTQSMVRLSSDVPEWRLHGVACVALAKAGSATCRPFGGGLPRSAAAPCSGSHTQTRHRSIVLPRRATLARDRARTKHC